LINHQKYEILKDFGRRRETQDRRKSLGPGTGLRVGLNILVFRLRSPVF